MSAVERYRDGITKNSFLTSQEAASVRFGSVFGIRLLCRGGGSLLVHQRLALHVADVFPRDRFVLKLISKADRRVH